MKRRIANVCQISEQVRETVAWGCPTAATLDAPRWSMIATIRQSTTFPLRQLIHDSAPMLSLRRVMSMIITGRFEGRT
jgi:hypothetical protein